MLLKYLNVPFLTSLSLSIYNILLVILAAFANSSMDVIEHKYEQSIYSKNLWFKHDWKRKYVDKKQYLGRKKIEFLSNYGIKINYPVLILDGWHFYKTIFIISLSFSAINTNTMSIIVNIFVFVLFFHLFYNHILIKK